DGIRDFHVTGVQTCALPISMGELHEVAAHQDGDLVHVELEPAASMELPGDVHLAVAALEADGSVDQLLQSLAQSVQRLSGFSREIGRASCRERAGLRGAARS